MVPSTFAGILMVWIFLAFLTLRDSTAHLHQEVVETLVVGHRFTAVGADSASFDQGASREKNAATATNSWSGVRKMMMKEVIRKGDVDEDVSKMITGAVPSVGKCNHRRKSGFSIEHKMNDGSQIPMKANIVGLASFSADYNVPKKHPPKNN